MVNEEASEECVRGRGSRKWEANEMTKDEEPASSAISARKARLQSGAKRAIPKGGRNDDITSGTTEHRKRKERMNVLSVIGRSSD